MQVFFTSRSADADPLREVAERRVRFAMRRMTWLVPRASVQLSDVNGPRGGVDKRCQIQLKTEGAGTVVIASIAREWRDALESALARATRVLLRIWRRGREHRSPRSRAIRYDS